MFLSNIQIFYIILIYIFLFFIIIKQDNYNVLKPAENKNFQKMNKRGAFGFLFVFIIFSLAQIENIKNNNKLYENNKEIMEMIKNDK